MNNWMADPFPYPDKPIDRGKVLDAETLERARRAGAATRTWTATASRTGRCPARHCRGLLHPRLRPQRRGQYSERPDDYKTNVDRLARKFETARSWVPQPEIVDSSPSARGRPHRLRHVPLGGRGGARPAAQRGRRRRRRTCACGRTRSRREVDEFIDRHERVYVVEQNRDAQMLQPAEAGSRRRARSASCAASLTTPACRSMRARSPTSRGPGTRSQVGTAS